MEFSNRTFIFDQVSSSDSLVEQLADRLGPGLQTHFGPQLQRQVQDHFESQEFKNQVEERVEEVLDEKLGRSRPAGCGVGPRRRRCPT